MDVDQQRLVQDVKILQKVNASHRDAFLVKYPGQVEHCLRLVMERLQLGLDKRGTVDPGNPDTWRLTTQELSDLTQCAVHLDSIRRGF
jgi:hypothetical protein